MPTRSATHPPITIALLTRIHSIALLLILSLLGPRQRPTRGALRFAQNKEKRRLIALRTAGSVPATRLCKRCPALRSLAFEVRDMEEWISDRQAMAGLLCLRARIAPCNKSGVLGPMAFGFQEGAYILVRSISSACSAVFPRLDMLIRIFLVDSLRCTTSMKIVTNYRSSPWTVRRCEDILRTKYAPTPHELVMRHSGSLARFSADARHRRHVPPVLTCSYMRVGWDLVAWRTRLSKNCDCTPEKTRAWSWIAACLIFGRATLYATRRIYRSATDCGWFVLFCGSGGGVLCGRSRRRKTLFSGTGDHNPWSKHWMRGK